MWVHLFLNTSFKYLEECCSFAFLCFKEDFSMSFYKIFLHIQSPRPVPSLLGLCLELTFPSILNIFKRKDCTAVRNCSSLKPLNPSKFSF
ncbi:unnamed protein product [Moneuplotes crassus]|uniref:Uncharacterized protein n=1 Tax=Euplotes crassus TaxID=5936 RepID=A0AAD1XWQ3_EUPCR|nr:unnamed protein product [Moneuplotes crassus]